MPATRLLLLLLRPHGVAIQTAPPQPPATSTAIAIAPLPHNHTSSTSSSSNIKTRIRTRCNINPPCMRFGRTCCCACTLTSGHTHSGILHVHCFTALGRGGGSSASTTRGAAAGEAAEAAGTVARAGAGWLSCQQEGETPLNPIQIRTQPILYSGRHTPQNTYLAAGFFNLSKHASHTRTASVMRKCGNGVDLDEQSPQKVLPQLRQWCLRTNKPNAVGKDEQNGIGA
jgi:hypothetical protein